MNRKRPLRWQGRLGYMSPLMEVFMPRFGNILDVSGALGLAQAEACVVTTKTGTKTTA